MSDTTKPYTPLDANLTLRGAYNAVDKSLQTSGFLTGQVGHKVVRIDTAAPDLDGNPAGDDFSYYDGAILLYTIRILYSDINKEILVSAERVA